MAAEAQKPEHNAPKKRPIIKVYDEDKIPDYPKKHFKIDDWYILIKKPVPEEFHMIYFFVCKLYEDTVKKLQTDIRLETEHTLYDIQKLINSLKQIRSGKTYAQFQKYSIKCESGKISLSTALFMAVCSLIVVIHYSLGTELRLCQQEYNEAMQWAMKEKLLVVDPNNYQQWTMMEIYRQIYILASKWMTINHENTYAPFYFLSVMEDKVAHLVLNKHNAKILDGTEGRWTRKPKESLIVPSSEYIDNVSNMLGEMDRTLIILTCVEGAFKETVIPNGYLDTHKQYFKTWIDSNKVEEELPDNLDSARQLATYYAIREGEIQESIRKNNGTKIKATKWVLHLTRSYQQNQWMLQEHTYNKKGIVLGVYPKRWQDHCLKLNTYVKILGAHGIKFTDSVFVQERNFWKIYTRGEVMRNVFILETMGHHIVICETKYYHCLCIEDALLLWTLLMKDIKDFMFNDGGKLIDLRPTFDPLFTKWNINYRNDVVEMDSDNDIVL